MAMQTLKSKVDQLGHEAPEHGTSKPRKRAMPHYGGSKHFTHAVQDQIITVKALFSLSLQAAGREI